MGKFSAKLALGAAATMMCGSAMALNFNAVVSHPENNAGVYSFSTEEYNPVLIKNQISGNGGAVTFYQDYLYTTQYVSIMGITGVKQVSYDMKDWSVEDEFTGSVSDIATALTFDPDLGLGFGCFFNAAGDGYELGQLRRNYFGHSVMTKLEKAWGACGFGADDKLYVIDEDGLLFTYDFGTFTATTIGETGLVNEWPTGGFIDKASNTFIYSIKTDAGAALYSVDLATAAATKLYDLQNEEQINGFYVPVTYPGNVPGQYSGNPSVGGFYSSSPNTGNFAFYTPRTLNDGTTATGTVTYHVYCNGKEIATGETEYGSKRVQIPLEVTEPGYRCYGVAFSNENGEGPRKYADVKYLGPDTPKPFTSCALSLSEGKPRLQWNTMSTTGLHGGNVDRSKYQIRIKRFPGGEEIGTVAATVNSFVDQNFEIPAVRTEFYYTIEAFSDTETCTPFQTTSFAFGPIVPPYSTDFNARTDFFGYTTVNAGTDNKTWEWDSDKVVKVSTSAKPANNYLVLPELKLKPGESYTVSVQARAYSTYYTETFTVVSGNAATPEALTTEVIPESTVNSAEYVTFEGTLVAPEGEGSAYLAIHPTTATNGGYLYIKSISISKGKSENAPSGVTDLTATADENGARSVALSFKLPTLTLGNDELTEITRVDISRDGEVIKTLTEGLTPGAEMTFTDSDMTAGTHTYTVACANSVGEGPDVSTQVFVGFAAPMPVASVKMKETEQGHVLASWTAVTLDAEGRTLGEGDVKYNVYKYHKGQQVLVAENVEGTSCEFDAVEDENAQIIMQTLVEAVSEGGKSKIVPSIQTAVGKPYTTPWSDSFANCSTGNVYASDRISGSDTWKMIPTDDFGTTPADGDGGMMYFEGYGQAACALLTGKIDLTEVVEPAFFMQVYHYHSSFDNENIVEVEARSVDDDTYVKLFSSSLNDLGNPSSWVKITVPLIDFEGQVIQLRISAYNVGVAFTHLDDFKISSNAAQNLSVTAVEAPLSVNPGENFSIVATIENNGTEEAKGYNVNLFMDEELVETVKGGTLAPEGKTTFTFTQNHSVLSIGTHTYTVEAEYGPDVYQVDNSLSFDVVVRSNDLPTVQNLTATAAEGAAILTWNAAQDLKVATTQTENFDAPALSWATKVEGWTFVDRDGGTIGGIGSKQLPVYGKQSFFVLDNTHPAFQSGNTSAFNAHSGTQYLCSMYSTIGGKGIKSDDWAISPELTGEPQVVSLYASSFTSDPDQPQYLETFQILYSTTDTNPDSFILIEEFANIPAQWRQYTAYIPEGGKYFAIRCVSDFKYMLFVDDVTFMAKNGATETISATGYNVYRDGAKINEAPVAENTYTDSTVDCNSTYAYRVSALYSRGESAPCEEVAFDSTLSGLTSIDGASIEISTAAGTIIVTGAEGLQIEVIAADGKIVAATTGKAVTHISAATGFYIVKVGTVTAKVAVR